MKKTAFAYVFSQEEACLTSLDIGSKLSFCQTIYDDLAQLLSAFYEIRRENGKFSASYCFPNYKYTVLGY